MPAQKYPGAAVAALTTSSFNSTDLNINIDDATGWPDGSTGKFVVIVEPGTDQAEKILVTSRAGLVLTIASTGDRGYDGTAAVSHGTGKTIRPSIDAASMQRWEDYVLTGHLPLAGGTMSGELILADQLLTRPLLKDFGEELQAHGAAGATETIDLVNGNVHSIILDANCTLTFSNPTATGDACRLRVIVIQDATGGRTITWPASVDWHETVAPTLSTAANAVDILDFITTDGGTIWRGRRIWSDAPAASSGSSVVTAQTTRTTGDVTMNSTAAFTADVDTGMDLTVAAVAGDKVELQFHGSLGAEAVAVAFDFVTRVAAADVNFVSSGTGTPYTYGMPGSRGESGDDLSVNPSRIYTVQAGDISGGNVTFRLRYKTVAAANKTLYASAGTNAGASAKNFGQ